MFKMLHALAVFAYNLYGGGHFHKFSFKESLVYTVYGHRTVVYLLVFILKVSGKTATFGDK